MLITAASWPCCVTWSRNHRRAAPDLVEVTQTLAVGLDRADLHVVDAALGAEVAHDRLDLPQVGPGHAREQVVLDLVVEAAQHEVDDRRALDVTGGQHLLAQEVEVVLGGQHRHALVVRCERHAHVEAEQRLVDADERERHPDRENRENRCQVGGEVHEDQDALPATVPHLRGEHGLDAVDVQAQAFEEQQREEQVRLPAGHPPLRAAGFGGLRGRPHERAGTHVRVVVFVVRVRVVPVVLGEPPAEAHADAEVADEQARRSRSDRACGRPGGGRSRGRGTRPGWCRTRSAPRWRAATTTRRRRRKGPSRRRRARPCRRSSRCSSRGAAASDRHR